MKTSVRLPESLSLKLAEAVDRLGMDKVEALNDGLVLWFVFQEADKQLANQLSDLAKRMKDKILREKESLREKAAKKTASGPS